ncbi:MAG: phosphoribosylglycinamide formyltransferase [Tissierellia bacterium]|nr:phosphoribosylglycinamide formyltransferase [Tissierellia bacterium]
MNIAVFVSGGGTNLQALLDAEREGFFKSHICLVLGNRPCKGLERVAGRDCAALVHGDSEDILRLLREHEIDLVVLAGYLKILPEEVLSAYEGRIINIHPSLLPKYGGRGMYGHHVHEAVFAHGEPYSGATVHRVTGEVDGGTVLLQSKVNIEKLKSPEEIADTVLVLEHQLLKTAVKYIEEERL